MKYIEKTVGSTTVYNGSIIHLDLNTVLLPDGTEAKREIVRHPGGVGVVALDDKGDIYLVEQYRAPYDAVLLEIPAGKLDKGEQPEKAALRELSEETGLDADAIEYMGDFYPSVGYTDEVLRMFLVRNLSQGEVHPDEGEFVETVRMPFDKAVDMVLSGKIKDGKTIAAILKAKLIIDKNN